MKKIISIAALAFCTLAFAEVWESEIIHETDEFTGHTVCLQIISNSINDNTGVAFTKSNNHGLVVTFLRHHSPTRSSDFIFYSGYVFSNDRVFLRFDEDDVVIIEPDRTDTSERSRADGIYIRFSADDYITIKLEEADVSDWRYIESATFYDPGLLERLMSVREDIQVRFRSQGEHEDFTLKGDIFAGLAQGFGQECLD
jgi:NDP-sugar pyrophosphorylase family protein